MKHYFNQFTKLYCLVLALLCSFGLNIHFHLAG